MQPALRGEGTAGPEGAPAVDAMDPSPAPSPQARVAYLPALGLQGVRPPLPAALMGHPVLGRGRDSTPLTSRPVLGAAVMGAAPAGAGAAVA